MSNINTIQAQNEQKHVKTNEFILYLMGVFFYTTMTGMVGGNRNAYLVNVLRLPEEQTALFNLLTGIIPFVLNFFIVMPQEQSSASISLGYWKHLPVNYCRTTAN